MCVLDTARPRALPGLQKNDPRSSSAAARRAARELHRDVRLIARSAFALPYLLGTLDPSGDVAAFRRIERPFSELNIRVYPFEAVRILVQAILSGVIGLPILVALLVAVGFYELGFTYPLELLAAALATLFSFALLRIPSPSGVFTSHREKNILSPALRDRRSVLTAARTFVAIPEGCARRRGNKAADGPATDNASSTAPGPAPAAPYPQAPLEEVFFYVNGIVEQGAMVTADTLLLERMTGRMCNPLVNPSHGIWLDLLLCLIGRDLNTAVRAAIDVVPIVVHHLALGRKVVLIGHSQGGIILSNVVDALVERAAKAAENASLYATDPDAFCDGLRRLEVYTFCSGADTFHGRGSGMFAEHFGAELDIVSRLGVLNFSGTLPGATETDTDWFGDVHMLPKEQGMCQGHLLKQSIFPALVHGMFGHDSTFWRRYMDHNNRDYVPIKEHIVENFSKEMGGSRCSDGCSMEPCSGCSG